MSSIHLNIHPGRLFHCLAKEFHIQACQAKGAQAHVFEQLHLNRNGLILESPQI